MSSGREHFSYSLAVFWAAVIVALLLPAVWQLRAICSGMLFGILFMDPDMDTWGSTNIRNWTFLGWLWYPYAAFFPHRRRHIRLSLFPYERTDVSHHWWFGTVSRLLYLIFIVASPLFCVRYFVLGNGWGQAEIEFLQYRGYAIFCIVGVWLADLLHIWQDAQVGSG